MKGKTGVFCFIVLTLTVLGGCSSQPAAKQAKQAAAAPDKIQGKAQVMVGSTGATDAALNAGGPSVYIWEGVRRYRLFLRTPVNIVHGNEYVVEGVDAQKVIDDVGDPDQGKNGYPLQSSCERVVRTAWSNLSFDEFDATVSLVSGMVKRYPARPLFLVTRIQPADAAGSAEPKEDKDLREVSVPAEKERASLIEGPTALTAPLWEPTGGTVSCQVVINSEGKISELETGKQLCEAVPWSKFRYQPPAQGGHPVKVSTEVEVRFDARK